MIKEVKIVLCIDNKYIDVIKQTIFVGNYIKNKNKGYNANIQLEFINCKTKEKGYINLDVGFEKKDNITNFLNKEYIGTPFKDDIFIEVFDTEKFIDTDIESKIVVSLKEIKANKVHVIFEVNDELIKIKFDGFLNFDFTRTKETFKS